MQELLSNAPSKKYGTDADAKLRRSQIERQNVCVCESDIFPLFLLWVIVLLTFGFMIFDYFIHYAGRHGCSIEILDTGSWVQ